MKKRNLWTNILYVLILVGLATFLIAEFALNSNEGIKTIAAATALIVAIISVALVDIVFPVIDNKDMLKNKKYLVLTIVKSVLFLAAAIVLLLREPFNVIKSVPGALIPFIVLYFIQYFISLDPKVPKTDDEDEDLEEIKGKDEEKKIESIEDITKGDITQDFDVSFDDDIEENK